MHPTKRLRRAHERLRTKLMTLESALSMGPDAWLVLRNTGFSLAKQLLEHIRFEERIVTACSRTLERYGEEVLASFALDHRQERRYLRLLNHFLRGDPSASRELVSHAGEAVGEALRRTMDLQETRLFPLLDQTDERPDPPGGRRFAGQTPLTETMTLNEVLRHYPQTRELLERNFICLQVEHYDAIDEVAWRHGMRSRELLALLAKAITNTTGAPTAPAELEGVTLTASASRSAEEGFSGR